MSNIKNLLPVKTGLILLAAFPLLVCSIQEGRAQAGESSFEERAEAYLMQTPPRAPGAFGAIARLASGKEADLSSLSDVIEHVREHKKDLTDFRMCGLLRLLYLYGHDPELKPEIRAAVQDALLKTKYWIDEPGRDDICTWSENHQIAFHSSEYLAGAMFPDRVFTNSGMSGQEHREKGRRLVMRWLGWRAEFGFSEWFSNVYYKIDLFALLNLADFAPDPEIRTRAAMTIDMLALNMALNSYRGYFISTHGRTYVGNILDARKEGVGNFFYLWWGEREMIPPLDGVDSGAVALATSSYRLPAAIYRIGRDRGTMENYQSHGVSVQEGPVHGIPLNDLESGMFYWGMGMYTHPAMADTTARMWKEYDLYQNKFFRGFARLAVFLSRMGVLDDFLKHVPIASRAACLQDPQTYNYRTADYVLSTALDHFPGQVNAQSFIWVAGMGPEAMVFTSHPGRIVSNGTPDHWVGNGANPRAAQYRNVAVIVYNPPPAVTLGEKRRFFYTHAYFPRHAFDETLEKDGWFFARKRDGYLALHSRNKAGWIEKGKWAGVELRARGLQNIWICQMGRKADNGSFQEFVRQVSNAELKFKGLEVCYQSPSLGEVRFGWTGPFTANGKEVPLTRPVRYHNPYVRAGRFDKRIEVKAGGARLILDFENGERIIAD